MKMNKLSNTWFQKLVEKEFKKEEVINSVKLHVQEMNHDVEIQENKGLIPTIFLGSNLARL